MAGKEDLRVKKTKQALNSAFAELIKEKPFEDISINELCNKADVRRATFYKHFKDKYDFVTEYIGFLRITYDSRPTTVSHLDDAINYYVNYSKRVVEYINNNEILVKSLLSSNILHIIIGLIAEKNYRDTCKKLEDDVNAGMVLPASVETVSAMLIGGVSTVVLQWLLAGKKINADTVTSEIAILVRNVLTV